MFLNKALVSRVVDRYLTHSCLCLPLAFECAKSGLQFRFSVRTVCTMPIKRLFALIQ